ncbi:MAG: hypothetical protein CMG24_01385 [Candidatus Marinimicrobia bacterium]|nr:hypothetical protein [Candidatus Neomarinimicrobiota bacterium]
MNIIIFIFLSSLFSFQLLFDDNSIDVFHDSELLNHPFSGGLNKPRVQWIDWDDDNDDDLFILDQDGYIRYMENISTDDEFEFIIRNSNMFGIYAGGWFHIADFDNDEDLDIVTQSQANAQQASYYVNNSGIMEYVENLSVLSDPVMTPTFADIDNDGDLDFFTGNYVGTVNFYENIGLNQNVPQYTFITNYWQEISIIGPSLRHGASAIKFIDLDGDFDLDLSWGDYFQQSMYIIWNIGTASSPLMNIENVTQQFPQNDPILTTGQNMPSFTDIDGDGDLDLFASVLSGAYGSQWINNFIYYENIGSANSPYYEYRTDNFLDGIDVLLNSTPEIYDIDSDGDDDLFIGTMVDPSENPWTGRIYFYRNLGDENYPIFELETTEFLGTDLGTDLSIVFGDLNSDSLPDAVVGNANGFIKIFINNGDESFSFLEDIPNVDLSGTSTPELGDIDGDGDLDLIVGESNGDILYFERIDSENVEFSLQFNLIETPYSYTAPELFDIDNDQDLDLLIGTAFDGIKIYENQGDLSFQMRDVELDFYGTYINLAEGTLYNGTSNIMLGLHTGGLYSLIFELCNKGDLNQDGTLDVLDVLQLVNIVMDAHLLMCESDINSDDIIDILDIISLVFSIIE